MRNKMTSVLALVGVVGLFPVLGAADAWAAPVGQVKSASGGTYLVRGGAKKPAKVGDSVEEHDIIETAADGSMSVTFSDNSQITAGPNSSIAVDKYKFDSSTLKGNFLARMRRGTVQVTSGDMVRNTPGSMQVVTPRSVLGVRGTSFVVEVKEE